MSTDAQVGIVEGNLARCAGVTAAHSRDQRSVRFANDRQRSHHPPRQVLKEHYMKTLTIAVLLSLAVSACATH